LTSKRPRRTSRQVHNARESIRQAHDAVEQLGSGEIDPASRLFFEFAAPLLLTARSEEEFMTASALAEFVWASTHFDARTQVELLAEFIDEAQVPPHMIPWLVEVYGELAARKMALVGE
jgi:hypothetical protein